MAHRVLWRDIRIALFLMYFRNASGPYRAKRFVLVVVYELILLVIRIRSNVFCVVQLHRRSEMETRKYNRVTGPAVLMGKSVVIIYRFAYTSIMFTLLHKKYSELVFGTPTIKYHS